MGNVNLNWAEINSAWSNIALITKIIQNDMKVCDSKLKFAVMPMHSHCIVHGNNKAYVLEGFGKAVENKDYVRAILAFAIYVKEICSFSNCVVHRGYPLGAAPVERMFNVALGSHSLSEMHMDAVVRDIVLSIRMFEGRAG